MESQINEFESHDNITMIIDILYDMNIIINTSDEYKRYIFAIINSQIHEYYINEINQNKNIKLTQLNKGFLIFIIKGLHNDNSTNNENDRTKLQIHYDNPTDLGKNNTYIHEMDEMYTNEDIKKHRRHEFDSQLNQRKDDFEKLFTKSTPNDITFSDNIEELPISKESMHDELEKMIQKRNYDIDVVSNPNSNNDKIKNNEIIEKDKKNVSWDDEKDKNIFFNKLKLKNKNNDTENIMDNKVTLESLKSEINMITDKLELLSNNIQKILTKIE